MGEQAPAVVFPIEICSNNDLTISNQIYSIPLWVPVGFVMRIPVRMQQRLQNRQVLMRQGLEGGEPELIETNTKNTTQDKSKSVKLSGKNLS